MIENKQKRPISIAFIYISVIFGAGLSSGREIISYFMRFGQIGLLGIAVATFAFGFLGFSIFAICIRKKINTYDEFVDTIAPKKLSPLLKISLSVFMFILFSGMLAAAGATINQAFLLEKYIGTIIMAVLCFIMFFYGIDGIIKINAILAPFVILGSIFIAIYIMIAETVAVFNPITSILAVRENFVFFAITYVSYNIITAVVVLSSMKSQVNTVKNAIKSSIFASILMFLLLICIALPIHFNYDLIESAEIPLLILIQQNSILIEYFYLIIMILAIFTTAATNGYSAVNFIEKRFKLGKVFSKVIVCSLAILMSFIGFSNIISYVYPIFAILGFLEILLIVKYFSISTIHRAKH